jgi:hypothetical protein
LIVGEADEEFYYDLFCIAHAHQEDASQNDGQIVCDFGHHLGRSPAVATQIARDDVHCRISEQKGGRVSSSAIRTVHLAVERKPRRRSIIQTRSFLVLFGNPDH